MWRFSRKIDTKLTQNRHVSFIGPYQSTSIRQAKSFYMYELVGYFILILKNCIKINACVDWVVASTCLKSCVLGKEWLFYKEHAGLRVNFIWTACGDVIELLL